MMEIELPKGQMADCREDVHLVRAALEMLRLISYRQERIFGLQQEWRNYGGISMGCERKDLFGNLLNRSAMHSGAP